MIYPTHTIELYYMHTVNDQPAMFDGDQIVFGLSDIASHEMRRSLRQIRRDQQRSREFRKSYKDPLGAFTYGYIRVRVAHD